MVGPGRLELPTSRLSGVRSNQLSYGPGARLAIASPAALLESQIGGEEERETKTAAPRTCVEYLTNQ